MTATQFLDLLADRDLVAPEVLQSLRQQMARAHHAIPPVAFANLLIDRGHLTFYQAMKLLNTGATVETVEEAESRRMAASIVPSPGSSSAGSASSNIAGQQSEVPKANRTVTEEPSLELQPLEEETSQAKSVASGPPAVTFFVDEAAESSAAPPAAELPKPTAAGPGEPPVQSPPLPPTPPLPPLAGETDDMERLGQVVNSPTRRGVSLPPIEWRKRTLLDRLGFGKK